jgi:hypothetical protein
MENTQFNNSPHPFPSQVTTSSPSNSHRSSMKVSDLPTSSSASVSRSERSLLEADFKPSVFSVICGRGKDSYDHIGNHHFRELACMFVARYSRAATKADKSEIVSELVGMIHQAEGTFCKFENGAWYKVDDCYAREKAGALLRDMVQTEQQAAPAKVKKAKKTKAKPVRPKFPKQIKTQTRQNDQKLADATAGHSNDFTAGHHSDDSIPTHAQQCSVKQLVEGGNAAASAAEGLADDSSMSTWSCLGDDPLLGFEENSLEDEDNYFDMLVFEGEDWLEGEGDYFDIFRMDAAIPIAPKTSGAASAASVTSSAAAAARRIVGVPPSSLFSSAAV